MGSTSSLQRLDTPETSGNKKWLILSYHLSRLFDSVPHSARTFVHTFFCLFLFFVCFLQLSDVNMLVLSLI